MAAKTAKKTTGKTIASRQTWTKTDTAQLRRMAREKTPAASIALSLGRTEGAIRQKALVLGVSLSLRPKKKGPKARKAA